MKNIILILMVLVLGFGTGFRSNDWGTTMSEINESAKLHDSNENTLLYKSELGNEDIFVLYYFYNNKLWKGVIHADVSETFYQYLKELVTIRHGQGDEAVYDSEYNNYATLKQNYKYGWLMKHTKWQVGDTVIELIAGTSIFLSFYHSPTDQIIETNKKAQDLQSF